MRSPRILITLAALLIPLSLGCRSTPACDKACQNIKEVKAIVKSCTASLASADYPSAKTMAETAVNNPRLASVNDVAIDQARFCYTTANTLNQLNEVTKTLQSLLTTVLGMFSTGGGLKLAPEDIDAVLVAYRDGRLDPKVQSAIGILLDSFTKSIKDTLEENRKQLEEIMRHKRFRWSITHLPVKIGDNELMDAGGVYDMGEIYLLYGMTRAISSTFYLVQGQDYTVNVSMLLNYLLNVQTNPVKNVAKSPGHAVVNLVAFIMGTSPTFLSLDKSLGAELMKQSGEGYSAGFGSVLDGVSFMKKRKGDQSKHVVEYQRSDVSGKGAEDLFILHLKFNNSANPIPLVDLQKFDGIAIPLRDDAITSLEHLRDSFAGVQGVYANLQRDIFPLVALGAVVLINSGAFEAVINMALENADQSMKDQAAQLLKMAGDNRDLITGVLVALVPVEIQFDFGHIFKNPGGLRDVLPAWTQPEANAPITDYTEATLVYSYECADKSDPIMTDKYFCAAPADTGHFKAADGLQFYPIYRTTDATWADGKLMWKNFTSNNFGTVWNTQAPIDPDGIDTIIPYIGFKDASFGGLLYLDLSAIKSNKLVPTKNGMELASLKSLNATLATIIKTVQGLIVK